MEPESVWGSSGFGFLVYVKMKVGLSRSVGRRLEIQQGALRVNIH